MKAKAMFFLVTLLVVGMASAAMAQSSIPVISLEDVVGLTGQGNLPTDGSTVDFRIRLDAGTSTVGYGGLTNGYKVYSKHGATWTTISGDTLISGWASWFNGITFNKYGVDGAGSDTIAFGFVKIFTPGLPPGFNQVAYRIRIGPIDPSDQGDTICVDSSWYPPTGRWLWAENASTGFNPFPIWDGPHCYQIGDAQDLEEIQTGNLPSQFALSQNYPNPFNPYTVIQFDIPTAAHVRVSIYNVLGQRVKTLVDEELAANTYRVDWDGSSDGGNQVSTGIYFYRMEAGDFVDTKKMMLLR